MKFYREKNKIININNEKVLVEISFQFKTVLIGQVCA